MFVAGVYIYGAFEVYLAVYSPFSLTSLFSGSLKAQFYPLGIYKNAFGGK